MQELSKYEGIFLSDDAFPKALAIADRPATRVRTYSSRIACPSLDRNFNRDFNRGARFPHRHGHFVKRRLQGPARTLLVRGIGVSRILFLSLSANVRTSAARFMNLSDPCSLDRRAERLRFDERALRNDFWLNPGSIPCGNASPE